MEHLFATSFILVSRTYSVFSDGTIRAESSAGARQKGKKGRNRPSKSFYGQLPENSQGLLFEVAPDEQKGGKGLVIP